jgi:hypothetical protein
MKRTRVIQGAYAVSDADLQRSRERFVAWLRWFQTNYPSEAPTQNALARRLGVAHASLSILLQPDSTRSPSFETLLSASKVLRLNVDVLLFTDPPPLPKATTAKKPGSADDDWPISAQT